MAFSGTRLRIRIPLAVISLLLATAIWLPLLHILFRARLADFRQPGAVAPEAGKLAARHLSLWEDPLLRQRELARMRASNAEWDFMGRTYLVLALANMSLSEAQQSHRYLPIIDAIIDETLRIESEKGMYVFLMGYARGGDFIAQPARSTFIDGEIAMMLAARQAVAPAPRYAPLLAQRVDAIIEYLSRGPVMCGESYPNECWMFCNALAVAAVRMSDQLDGRDHSQFIARWLETLKARLIHKESGLLVSSFTYDGRPMVGPEGSSIWMIAHCLQLIDPDFAASQYRLAREELAKSTLGFGYAREWPATWVGRADVDSGPIVPIIKASAGSSGLAVLGAASFGDEEYLRQLLATLQFAGFPLRQGGQLRYGASNQVGDAVLLYSLVQGPLWDRMTRPREARRP